MSSRNSSQNKSEKKSNNDDSDFSATELLY